MNRDPLNDTGQDAPAPSEGPLSSLLKSLTGVMATLVAMVQTRLELLTTELQEEIQRAAFVLLWAFVALFAAGIGLFLVALAVIFAFWDTHRLLAALIVTALFFVLSAVATRVLFKQLRGQPRLLQGTLDELSRDRDRLRSRL